MAQEAPYRLPGQLDLQRMHALISAQRSQAIDHAWALREDPDYFASTAEEYREHRCELILDEFGNTHPHASDFPLYNKAVRHMASDAHCLVFIWDEILQRIVHVQDLVSQHSADISVEKDLPNALHEKLSELRFFLEAVMLNKVGDLGAEFHASPPLRQYYYRANPDDLNLRKFDVRLLELPAQDTSLKRVLQLEGAICNSGGRDCFTMHVLMDEFERLMQADPQAKALVSAHVAKSLSQLSIFAECLHQLHQFQPWAHKIENDIKDYKVSFAVQYDKVFKHWGLIIANYRKFETRQLYILCSPRDGKFAYPAHEHPTRATVEKMRSAEAALDVFWRGANAHWLGVVRTTPGALVKQIMGERTLIRTQPWSQPLKAIKLSKGRPPLSRASDPFSEHSHDITKQITGTFTRNKLSVDSKIKTKGVSVEQSDNMPILAPAPSSPLATRPTFKVDKRSLKVFRTLFHTPNLSNQPGEVAWPDLLHAMISLGFGAEKLRSSAWHFTPPASVAVRSIQLHEPHPGNKLPFVLARHYGRRLNITFQWTSESFELA